jgi:15-cis-phytoene desaturase
VITNVPLREQAFFRSITPHVVDFRARDGAQRPIELPQLYHDWSLMLAHFPASAAAVKRFLPEGFGLEPVTVAPGIGLVTLAGFDYRRPQTLQPYGEVGVMFPVRYRPLLSLPAVPLFRPEWFNDLGFYIWQLPVTTQEACDAGRLFWNFPKTVGRIEFTEVGGRVRCTWWKDDMHVLTLDVRTARTTLQLRNFLAYSVMAGRVQQTLVQTLGEYDESRFGFDASFALGDHPIAQEMRQLGMVEIPIGRLYSPSAKGVLPFPSAVPFTSVPAVLQAPRALRSMVARAIPKSTPSRVAILGGGVAGLSAAHELAERGFRVTVYEREEIYGGKARSFGAKNSAHRSRPALPAEHGFRFFPGFYKHLPHTMARIPCRPGGTVADNLVVATRLTVELVGDANLIFPARLPVSLGDVRVLATAASLLQQRTGCSAEEIAYYIERVWQLLTSCKERRFDEYEQIPWWEYIGAAAPGRSDAYRRLASTTRALVAADPKTSSTRTVGSVLLQLLFDFATPGGSVDRVLNGPTNEVWIDPWVAHLETLGVEFKHGTIERIELDASGRVASVLVGNETVRADYYVAAVPVERMAKIIERSPDLVAADPGLANVIDLSHDVDTMAGIQFYFKEALPFEGGHILHLDSEWALTSLAQAQFWARDLAGYGDGTVRDILSVDISNFYEPGNGGKGKSAEKSSRAEIETEVWRQLQESLPILKGLRYAMKSLDPAISDRPGPDRNREPLLVNKIKRWHLRPQATTAIPNLFLASDYVQTFTDLATMEGANEAARRAVNGILEASRSPATPCEIWDLHEPALLAPWRWIDRIRYRLGMPWNSDFPLALRGLEFGLTLVNSVATTLGVGVSREVAPAGDTTVSAEAQKGIGDVLEDLFEDLKRGDRAAIRRLFARYAVITLGLEHGPVDQFLPAFTRKVDVTVQAIPRLYQLGGRVHVVLAVRLSDPDAAPGGPSLEGHVHVVMVRQRGGQSRRRGGGWAIASLRYRRAGEPARIETPPGWRSPDRRHGRPHALPIAPRPSAASRVHPE